MLRRQAAAGRDCCWRPRCEPAAPGAALRDVAAAGATAAASPATVERAVAGRR